MLTIKSLFHDSGDKLEQYNNTTEILEEHNAGGGNFTYIVLALNKNETLVKDFTVLCVFNFYYSDPSNIPTLEIPENVNFNIQIPIYDNRFYLSSIIYLNGGKLNITRGLFTIDTYGEIQMNKGTINLNGSTMFEISNSWKYSELNISNGIVNLESLVCKSFANCSKINFENLTLNVKKIDNKLPDTPINFSNCEINCDDTWHTTYYNTIEFNNSSTLNIYSTLSISNLIFKDSTANIINTSESVYGTFNYQKATINNSNINIGSLCSFNQTSSGENNFSNVNIQNNSGSIIILTLNADNLNYTSTSVDSNVEFGNSTCNFNNSTLTNEGGTIKLKGEVYFKNSNYISTNSNSTLLTTNTNTFTNSNIYFYNGILTNEGILTIEKMGNMSCNFLTLNNIKPESSIFIKLFNPIYFSNSTLNLLSISNISVNHICFMGQNSKIVIGENTYKSHFDKIGDKPITDYNYYFIYDTSKLDKVDSFETTLKSHSEQISSLNSKVGIDSNGNHTDSGLISNVSFLTSQFNELDATVGDEKSGIILEVSNIKTTSDTNASNITDLTSKVQTNTNDISTLKSTIATNSSDITDLKNKVKTNTDNISTNSSDITNLKSKVKTNSDNISTNTSNIESLTNSIDSHSTQISNLNYEVGIDSDGISTDSGLKKNVSTLTEQLNNLNTTAEKLQTQIGNSENGIIKNITDLQTQIGNSENGIVKDISDLQTQIGNISETVESNKSELNQSISDLSSTVNSEVTKLQNQINDIDKNIKYEENKETKYISNLYSTVKSNKLEFDTFTQNTENKLNEKQTQITTNTTDISNLKDIVNGNSESDGLVKIVKKNTSEISTLKDTINGVNGSDGLAKIVKGNTDNISDLNSKFSNLDKTVNGDKETVGLSYIVDEIDIIVNGKDGLADTVENLNSKIIGDDGLTSKVTSLKSNVETNTSNISNLDSKINGETGLAKTVDKIDNIVNGENGLAKTVDNNTNNISALNKIVNGENDSGGLVKTVDKNTSDILTLKDTVNDIKAGGSTIEEALKQTIKDMSTKVDNLDVVVNDSENGLVKKMENADSDILRIYDCIGEINEILDVEDVDEILERKKEEFSSVLDKILDIIEKRPQEISSNNLKMFVLSLMMIKNRK